MTGNVTHAIQTVIRAIVLGIALGFIVLFMMAAQGFGQLPSTQNQFFGATGIAAANGFVCTTVTGTSTNLATYRDAALTVANQNPIRLNAAGRPSFGGAEVSVFPQAAVYRVTVHAAGTGSTCNGTTVGAVLRTADGISDNALIYSAALALDSVRVCRRFPGANAGVKIAACITDLPSTGGTADATGIEGVQTSTVNPFAGVTKHVTLLLGDITLSTTITWTISGANQGIIGIPQRSILKYTGSATTDVILLDGSSAANGEQFILDGLHVDANHLATNAIHLQKTSFSKYRQVSAVNAVDTLILCGHCVGVILDTPLLHSVLPGFSAPPASTGIKFEAFAGTGSYDNTILNAYITGITTGTGKGIWDLSLGGTTVIGGAIEGCDIGYYIDTLASGIKLFNMDFEVNLTQDIYVLGFLNEFYGINAFTETRFASPSYLNRVFGGRMQKIILDAGTSVSSVNSTAVYDTYTDNGTNNSNVNVYILMGASAGSVDDKTTWPLRSLEVRSLTDATPTQLTVRAHSASQGATNLVEVKDATGVIQWSIDAAGKVGRSRQAGTALVAGDFALESKWGSTASVGTISGNDTRGTFTVTSTGTGQAADPYILITFKDGAWPATPFAVVVRNGGSQNTVVGIQAVPTTTQLQIFWRGTPVAAETYTFTYMVMD